MGSLTKEGIQQVLIRLYEQGREIKDEFKALNNRMEKLEQSVNEIKDFNDKININLTNIQKVESLELKNIENINARLHYITNEHKFLRGKFNELNFGEPLVPEFESILKNTNCKKKRKT